MPLRSRLDAHPETIRELELAAEQRYDEAQELWRSNRNGAAIYLFGYVAEMILKCSYLRFSGERATSPVTLAPARAVARRLRVDVPYEAYHSLRFWALLLREARRSRGRALPPDIDSRLVQRSRRLYQNWWVVMRYHQDRAAPLEVKTVFEDVTWLRDNYPALWR